MNCPVCDQKSRVLETDQTSRRRECMGCGHRFTTIEILRDADDRRRQIIEDAQALAERIREAV